MIQLRLYLYAAAAIALAGFLALLHHVGYVSGRDAADEHWQAQSAKAAGDAQKKLDEANARVRATEADATERIANLSTNYEKQVSDEKSSADARVAALRAGTDRLRVAVNPGSCRGADVRGAPAPASGSDGGTTADLQPAVAAGLESLAGEADAVTLQLHLAQDTIRTYYAACGPHAAVRGAP